jgi:glycosyltransferase involved in cell wall biosynthesis
VLGSEDFDIVHAQDCLSANAALELRDDGEIAHVIRTVHHVDDFTSPSLIDCQHRSIVEPDLVLCVSSPWVARLADEFGVRARLVRNGVDRGRFRAARDAAERAADREALGLGSRLVVLTVGGVEPRKGSLTLLDGFARLRALAPGSTRCWWWPAGRRCSTTATRSRGSARGRKPSAWGSTCGASAR